jgi:hypothetical protein
MISTHTDDEFGYSDVTELEVLRAGKVVCKVPYGSHSSHEHHRGHSSSEIVAVSREPLRFHVRTTFDSNEFPPSMSCTGFELVDGGACRTLFDRSCSEDECTLRSTIAMVPGTGKIRGQVMRDGKPFPGLTVQLESQFRISDEHGAFSFEARPGAHEIVLLRDAGAYSPNVSVSTRPGQDAQVAITIDCACCRAP